MLIREIKKAHFLIDIIVLLTDQLTADPNLYVEVTDTTGYDHRSLTIQEIPDPCNPDDPLNPNLEYDILDRQNNHAGMVPGSSPLQQNVPRYWRVRCYTKLRGDADENGQVDHNDLKFIAGDNWLKTTHDSNDDYVGNNYDPGDRNHDGWNDFLDFAIIGEDWLQTEDGTPISKLSIDPHERQFQLESFRNFYSDKVQQVKVARLVVLPQNYGMPQYNQGIIPQLSATKEQTQTPTLRRMLALSQNNHNGHLNKSYETIDNKLNHKAFKASQGRKMLYRA